MPLVTLSIQKELLEENIDDTIRLLDYEGWNVSVDDIQYEPHEDEVEEE